MLLSLPPELLYEIFEKCSRRECCHLRATCRILTELADPIVFRCLSLHVKESPHITEHQIVALATRSSKACEFTREISIARLPNDLRASKQSGRHFGHCDDLRALLPTAISALRNVTCFRWIITDDDPAWLLESLMQAAACLPKLTELDVWASYTCRAPTIPLGLVTNLSKLSVTLDTYDDALISQIATVIANSPQLKSLSVSNQVYYSDDTLTLCKLFAKLSAKNPLRLEHLDMRHIDATVDQTVLPHLTHLTSFRSRIILDDYSVAQSVWASFLVSDIRLSDVEIEGVVTEELMLYLSSFSGLKRLILRDLDNSFDTTLEDTKNMLFTEVLPKHANSLQRLDIIGYDEEEWLLDHACLKMIKKSLQLRYICVCIDGEEGSMPVQLILDAIAHLPELKVLRVFVPDSDIPAREAGLSNVKPTQGLRFLDNMDFGRWYVLENDVLGY